MSDKKTVQITAEEFLEKIWDRTLFIDHSTHIEVLGDVEITSLPDNQQEFYWIHFQNDVFFRGIQIEKFLVFHTCTFKGRLSFENTSASIEFNGRSAANERITLTNCKITTLDFEKLDAPFIIITGCKIIQMIFTGSCVDLVIKDTMLGPKEIRWDSLQVSRFLVIDQVSSIDGLLRCSGMKYDMLTCTQDVWNQIHASLHYNVRIIPRKATILAIDGGKGKK